MPVDDNAIMQAINARHRENRDDIREQGVRLDAMVSAQERTANAQESGADKLDRICMIVEGDGNGNPGLVRKFDTMASTVERMAATQDAVFEGAKRVAKFTLRYLIPALILWLATWFSSPSVRNFMHQFTMNLPHVEQSESAGGSGHHSP